MTPSGKTEEPGDRGEMGECKIHGVDAAIVGLPEGMVADAVGASAFLGGRRKFYHVSVNCHSHVQIAGAYTPCLLPVF